jgi:hypothetical protein
MNLLREKENVRARESRQPASQTTTLPSRNRAADNSVRETENARERKRGSQRGKDEKPIAMVLKTPGYIDSMRQTALSSRPVILAVRPEVLGLQLTCHWR